MVLRHSCSELRSFMETIAVFGGPLVASLISQISAREKPFLGVLQAIRQEQSLFIHPNYMIITKGE